MLKDPMKLEWFLLDQPWVDSQFAGTSVLAGDPDPHIGLAVADCMIIDFDHYCEDSIAMARAVASHIVESHNKMLFSDH